MHRVTSLPRVKCWELAGFHWRTVLRFVLSIAPIPCRWAQVLARTNLVSISDGPSGGSWHLASLEANIAQEQIACAP
eukprot:1866334-Amphidinium_carterae.1